MENFSIELNYPIDFRAEDALALGEHLKRRHSVVLIGMKRVGISNFLRFFVYHKDIPETYIKDGKKHLFVSVDLNDMVEREIFAFWMLTLKRTVDTVEINPDFDTTTKKYVESLFLDSIQSKDLLLLIDNIRKAIDKIIEKGFLPTIFFIRFERMQDRATREFINNLESWKLATNNKLAYVFTSYRRLDQLVPEIFNDSSLSLASNTLYLKLAKSEDIKTIAQENLKHYSFQLSEEVEKALFEYSGNYVQYLQLALIALHESGSIPNSKKELFDMLTTDERITLQSEEIWESLTEDEKSVLQKVKNGQNITSKDKMDASYLWDTGLIQNDGKEKTFSPIFEYFLKQLDKRNGQDTQSNLELTKKENLLFNFLLSNINQICERENIISSVWPEEEALGVSDWAIDRLVARVRSKLKKQNSNYQIITAKTRGFKLIES